MIIFPLQFFNVGFCQTQTLVSFMAGVPLHRTPHFPHPLTAQPEGPAEVPHDFWSRLSTWEICYAWGKLFFCILTSSAVQTLQQSDLDLRTEEYYQVPVYAVRATVQCSCLILNFLCGIVLLVLSKVWQGTVIFCILSSYLMELEHHNKSN